MDFHFLVMEKSWKINVEKEGAPCMATRPVTRGFLSTTVHKRLQERHRVSIALLPDKSHVLVVANSNERIEALRKR